MDNIISTLMIRVPDLFSLFLSRFFGFRIMACEGEVWDLGCVCDFECYMHWLGFD